MKPQFNKRELYRYLAKKVDAETHARIAAEIADPQSATSQAYEELRAKLLHPFQINWSLLLADAVGSDSGPASSEADDDATPTEDDFSTYFDLELPDLMAEFELAEPAGAFRGPADHPLAPHLPVLKDFLRNVWKWPERRDRPEYQDIQKVARDLAQAISGAKMNFPFPVDLIAVTLVKTGLDRLCKE